MNPTGLAAADAAPCSEPRTRRKADPGSLHENTRRPWQGLDRITQGTDPLMQLAQPGGGGGGLQQLTDAACIPATLR
ncbi:MAG: hypothetical protein RLZZ631_2048 [Cyanobacteriota bacterium]|jgi:hypothetical protein